MLELLELTLVISAVIAGMVIVPAILVAVCMLVYSGLEYLADMLW